MFRVRGTVLVNDQLEISYFDSSRDVTTAIKFYWFLSMGVAGRRLVAQPGGLTLGFAVNLVSIAVSIKFTDVTGRRVDCDNCRSRPI